MFIYCCSLSVSSAFFLYDRNVCEDGENATCINDDTSVKLEHALEGLLNLLCNCLPYA